MADVQGAQVAGGAALGWRHCSIVLPKQLHDQQPMPSNLTCVVDDCNLLGPQQLLRDGQGADDILRHTAA